MEDVISGRSYFLFRNGLRGNIFEAGHSVCAYARGWALLVRFDSIDRWIGTISRLEDTHTLVCTCIYTYWTVGKRRKRQIVEMEEGQAAGTVPFVRVVLARSVRQDESLWDYSMTRVLEDGPCLADPTSSRRSFGTTRGYIPVSRRFTNRSKRLCMELARSLLDPNWKYSSGLRNAAWRNLSSSDL